MKTKKLLSILLSTFFVTASYASSNVEVLYKKCANCHGEKAEKKALGISDVIANWDAKKIEKALLEYKEGIRNAHSGNYGGLMKGQVKSLSQDDIKALAKYISSLKNKK